MEFADVVARRRMCRSYTTEPVERRVLDRILRAGTVGPSAGFSQGLDLLVLEGSEATRRYWSVTLGPSQRQRFGWPGLLLAPVLVIVVTDPGAYLARYSEPDKAASGLGTNPGEWPVPYWFVDAGAAAMAILYAAVDEGLGALLFGAFEHEAALRSAFGVPEDRCLVATIALGHPAPDRPSRSASRPRRTTADVVHHGRWGTRST